MTEHDPRVWPLTFRNKAMLQAYQLDSLIQASNRHTQTSTQSNTVVVKSFHMVIIGMNVLAILGLQLFL